MNEEEKFTWKDAFLGMPAYIAEGFRGMVTYWRNAPPREWVAEAIWLGILVALFYYGIHGIMYAMHTASDMGVDPNGPIGWLLTFSPIIFVFVLFSVQSVFSGICRIIFKWQDEQ